MQKDVIQLEPELVTIFSQPEPNEFTVLEIRSAYMSLPGSEQDQNKAQRIVYREILKLTKKGLLNRVDDEITKKTTYKKTKQFDATRLVSRSEIKPTKQVKDKADNKIIKELRKRIQSYNNEIRSLLAQCDEIASLYDVYKGQENQLHSKFNKAREKSQNFQSKVQILEVLLKEQLGSTQ